MKDFEKHLEKYAKLLVSTGLNIQPGQRVLVSASLEQAVCVRAFVKEAYRAGAKYVAVFWADEEVTKTRFLEAPDESFDYAPQWRADAYNDIAKNADCMVGFTGGDPDLLRDIDQEKLQRSRIAGESKIREFRKIQKSNGMSWLVASAPTAAWAAKIFASDPSEDQMDKLWDAIFTTCRVYEDDPIAAWRQHNQELQARASYMNEKQYDALRYTGGGTDFTLGLPEGHIWASGASETKQGIEYIANMPTEEIFTLPHRDQADGVVKATKPLNYGGTVIEDIEITFKDGKIVKASASTNQDSLDKIISIDDGAKKLGEVALVPHSSAISRSGILFFNTLFDENASCHLAIGSAYNFTLKGGDDMDDKAFNKAGGNTSLTHVDFMIGSDKLDIFGITKDGNEEPVMKQGEWAFEI
ncbi:MAG: aminopeptidase [Patescibacteria group bacterium]